MTAVFEQVLICYDFCNTSASINNSKGFYFGEYNRVCTTNNANKTIGGTAHVYYDSFNSIKARGLLTPGDFGISVPDGYIFVGWRCNSNNRVFTAKNVSYLSSDMFEGCTSNNVWMTAQIIRDDEKPTGFISSSNNVASKQQLTLLLNDNYGLAGYYFGKNDSYLNNTYYVLDNSFLNNSVTKTIYESGTYYLTVKDITGNISATESITFYQTTLDPNSGSVSPSKVLTPSHCYFDLPVATKNGYILKSWSTSLDGTFSYTDKYLPVRDSTLYAQWAKEVTVTLDANDGYCEISSIKVGVGLLYNNLPVPTKENYNFDGWFTSDNQLVNNNTSVKINTDHKLEAHWSRDSFLCDSKYEIDYNKNKQILFGDDFYLKDISDINIFFNNEKIYARNPKESSTIIKTGTVVSLADQNDKIYEEALVVIFGDVNGDGHYDGMDSVLISCIAHKLLSKTDIGVANYLAADCNQDGIINETDIAMTEKVGITFEKIHQKGKYYIIPNNKYLDNVTYGENISFISDIYVVSSSLSGTYAKRELQKKGYNIIDYDLNKGAGGKYIYMGYKTTNNYDEAIKDIRFYSDLSDINWNSIDLWFGDEFCNYTMANKEDLNNGAGGNYIYVFYSKNSHTGVPIKEIGFGPPEETYGKRVASVLNNPFVKADLNANTKKYSTPIYCILYDNLAITE